MNTEKNKSKFSAYISKNSTNVALFIFMVVMFVAMGMIRPSTYFSIRSFNSMLSQITEIGIIALGTMLPIISGGFDLSMVGIGNLSGIIASYLIISMVTPETGTAGQTGAMICGFLLAMVVGAFCGYLNGFVISKFGTPPMIVTLGSSYVFMGIAIILTEGSAVTGFPEVMSEMANANIFKLIPVPFFFFVIVAIVVWYLLQKTPYGKKLFMVGSNKVAAEFSGINVGRVLRQTYTISGLLASIACVIMYCNSNQAKADYGTSYTLQAIMCAVLGGTDPNGGVGSVMGVIFAIFAMQFMSTGMNSLRMSNGSFLRQIIWGVALLAVIAINVITAHVKAKKALKKS
jgi:ribose/xylose/arabinose/galactoside ABC-type transport system protein